MSAANVNRLDTCSDEVGLDHPARTTIDAYLALAPAFNLALHHHGVGPVLNATVSLLTSLAQHHPCLMLDILSLLKAAVVELSPAAGRA